MTTKPRPPTAVILRAVAGSTPEQRRPSPHEARRLPALYRPGERGAPTMTMHAADVLALNEAVRAIERPSVGARIASVVGSPIERLIGMLPKRTSSVIAAAARKAIHGALTLSL